MRTTLNLDDELVKEAKIAAIRQGRTLTSLVEDAVRKELATQAGGASGSRRHATRIVLPTAPLNFPTGLDTDSNAAVRDFLDEADASS